MAALSWYWHRLRAMSLGEMAQHARKKFFQFVDARRQPNWNAVPLEAAEAFPQLPKPEEAPAALRAALKRDMENILAGRWKALGHLELQVDDPPLWHCDYLAKQNLAPDASAFRLNYRELPGGADSKLIWELSRWYALVRLAQAAYVLSDERAARKCIQWLEDWVAHNPPYRGWNWTSALETGLRLVQFTWMDALLTTPKSGVVPATKEKGRLESALNTLRYQILPAHAWFTWRHKSFGSSANNHLIGELAGLIIATVRWPALARWGPTLEELQRRWEHEVLAQFAEDGGNKEQALHYHLFSWEFCWQVRMALLRAGRAISPHVEQRLNLAAEFFDAIQVRGDPWDYGDSDSAFVTPLFLNEMSEVREWQDWISDRVESSALAYWLTERPFLPRSRGGPTQTRRVKEWWVFDTSGMAIHESGFWWLRWDLSPLGYLTTAAHGHLDALHLSIWFKGVAIVIDPGTGAYYADQKLRYWLASRAAHNGPCLENDEFPSRRGTFLWSQPHSSPTLETHEDEVCGVLDLPGASLRRGVNHAPDGLSWQVQDQAIAPNGAGKAFDVRWQFAPGTRVKRLNARKFVLSRNQTALTLAVGDEWKEVTLVETESERGGDAPLAGTVSAAFRQTCFAPYLLLKAPGGDAPRSFTTTFSASGSP
jgi:hypothetical protein